ncbi:MAG: hypothetical protein RIR51_1161 [Bacteroidota bacterium]|jgi:uncharacterized membrane protein YfcA
MLSIIGYFASLLIGISLGLIGGGGSILTVPVLVYFFNVEPVLATAYSLFIVGSSSLVGAMPKYRQGLVNLKTSIIFGLPAILSVYGTRKFIVPMIPDILFTVGNFEFTKGIFLMVLFATLMVAASVSMIKEKKGSQDLEEKEQVFNYPIILLEGIFVGVLTGLVGAGGGFLIIPALVILSKLPMKQAVGTSLLIIAAKSLFGFLGDVGQREIDWQLLLIVTILAIGGIFIGDKISKKVDGNKLKKGFGYFVMVMGLYILIQQIFF